MYCSIEEAWNVNNTNLPIMPEYPGPNNNDDNNKYINNIEGFFENEYASYQSDKALERLDNNILIEEPPRNHNKIPPLPPFETNEPKKRYNGNMRFMEKPSLDEILNENSDIEFSDSEYGPADFEEEEFRRRNSKRNKKVIEKFSDKKVDNCEQILYHIMSCDECYNKLRKKMNKESPIDKFFTNDVKDILMVIIIGIFIILILDIFVKILKKF